MRFYNYIDYVKVSLIMTLFYWLLSSFIQFDLLAMYNSFLNLLMGSPMDRVQLLTIIFFKKLFDWFFYKLAKEDFKLL